VIVCETCGSNPKRCVIPAAAAELGATISIVFAPVRGSFLSSRNVARFYFWIAQMQRVEIEWQEGNQRRGKHDYEDRDHDYRSPMPFDKPVHRRERSNTHRARLGRRLQDGEQRRQKRDAGHKGDNHSGAGDLQAAKAASNGIDMLRSSIVRVADFCVRRAFLVIALVVAMAAGSAVYATRHFGIKTDVTDLIRTCESKSSRKFVWIQS
jgi:hypothetical protein